MTLVGRKTESIYRRYAIVSESDLASGGREAQGGQRVTACRGTVSTRFVQVRQVHGNWKCPLNATHEPS
jgi:hypothetical protein